MNQILNMIKYKKKIVTILKVQLLFSLIGIIAIVWFSTNASTSENYAKDILITQKITAIYQKSDSVSKDDNELQKDSEILGSIEIPKLGIAYPVFNTFTEELLEISPCKFSGPNLGEYGNIAIAGHNLENGTFFSNLNQIEIDDIIYLYSNYGEKLEYTVYKTYETVSDDLAPIATNFIDKKELTLVTCNNTNKKRFIVKALFIEN